jgi:hypothetical protein
MLGLAFEASADPAAISAQAALAPHRTTEHKESANNMFMPVTC